MKTALEVRHGSELVGHLTPVGSNGLAFAYADAWLSSPTGFGISLSLPLSKDLDARRATTFFANLLPEGNVRTLVCRRFGVSEGNDFALLAAIGGECAGALTIVPEGAFEARKADYVPIEKAQLLELARGHEVLPTVDDGDAVRLSLAGAQDKLPVLEDDGRFYLPRGGSASTHILKFPNRDFKHLPANEVLMATLAARLGLPTVATRWEKLGKEGVCVVARYDRVRDESGHVSRLHQEDLCQALGVSPHAKYEQEGGPSFVACVDAVRATTVDPLIGTRTLVRWMLFNAITGNADGHAKNVSLLFDDGWRLAPLYDLVCTRAYERLDRRLAMRFGGESDPDKLRAPHFEAMAKDLALKPSWLAGEASEMCEAIPSALDEAILAAGVARSPAVERIGVLVRKQARRLGRELSTKRVR